ncbi:MAG: CYTH and CHAD domain-containing protein, partial [Mycobacterium sp.]|nr:CYTH and CHAD domain-containing protein [Mycobacterium sp.]
AVDERFELPDLHDIVAGGHVDHDTVDLTNVYYDTPEGHLQTQGILLRRRDGDEDAGWQLKTPTALGGTELLWPPTEAPPVSLTDLLTGVGLDKQLTSVATIHTVRNRYRIRDPKAKELYAEVADDDVRAWVDERLLAWREIHVDLGPATDSMPKRLIVRLRSAGARPSRYPSKLAHVLPQTAITEPASPAARALARYLGTQIDAIVAGDMALRRGQEPYHDTRVAIRRLRSTLRIFGKVMDRSAIGDLDDELRWFAGLLGDARDCQVQRRRFTEALDGFAEELILGPVRSRIRNELQSIEGPARTRLRKAMDSERYLAIMAVLRKWRTDPPVNPDTTTAKLIAKARRARRKADRRLAAAVTEGDDAMLHQARKAAKRARYAAELVKPVRGGKKEKRIIKHYKGIQSVLGDHQDTVVASAALRRMALAAGTTVGENGFSYGLLFSREQQIAQDCRRRARKLV